MLLAKDVPEVVANGFSCLLDVNVDPKFKVGDDVITKNINPSHHTRLPRYARAKRGVIERDHGVFPFPDTNASDQGEKPQHVYLVRFSAQELWGPEAPATDSLRLDLWDDYLLPAPSK